MGKTIDNLLGFVRHPVTKISTLVVGVLMLYASLVPYKMHDIQEPDIEKPGIFCRYAGYDHNKDGFLDDVIRRVPIGVGEFAMFEVKPNSKAYRSLQTEYSLN